MVDFGGSYPAGCSCVPDDENGISLEQVEVLYRFLQGECPEPFCIEAMPNLSPEQAFSVIYYLQEGLHILPDKYEQCRVPGCNALFDSEQDGCLAGYCDSCGCQHPEGYDPESEDCDGCCGCPAVNGPEEQAAAGR